MFDFRACMSSWKAAAPALAEPAASFSLA